MQEIEIRQDRYQTEITFMGECGHKQVFGYSLSVPYLPPVFLSDRHCPRCGDITSNIQKFVNSQQRRILYYIT